jgi:hypothetical protein
VCRCFRGAFRSASRIASTNSTAAFNFHLGRCVLFRGDGNALPIASRTIRRCTPNFLATPTIVPTPNSYSRRISSYSSSPDMPSSEVYAARFGGLLEAYRRIGYEPPGNFSYVERDRKLLPMRRNFVATVISALQRLGASVRQGARTKLLLVNGSLTIRVAVARCCSVNHSDSWLLRPLQSPLLPDISVFARLSPGNETILDYFYLPAARRILPS